VTATLRSALSGQGLGIDAIKDDRVGTAEDFSTIFTAIFLILGLFSIAAGILLIVLIFTMLAAERRSEMGMERAVGAQRGQLVQQFIAEGSGYAILAGLVGSALGVAAAIGIAKGMSLIFGDYVPVEPHIEPRSLVVAYCLGVVITFLTVVAASWKVSRLNIVAAVRNIPDVVSAKRRKRTLVWAGLLLVFGGLMTMAGPGGDQAILFMTGMSLLPFGVALALRFFGVPPRPLFTTTGLYLLVFWLLPEKQFERIFGEYSGDFSLFFVSGIFLVIAATIVILNNLDFLLAGVSKVGGLFQSKLPAVRTAIAYPGAARGRTGMTVAMFSLIVFSLVMMATMNTNFTNALLGDEANAGWDVRADQIGSAPIADVTGALQAKGVDTSGYQAVAVTHRPSAAASEVRVAGDEDQTWKDYFVHGMDEAFIGESKLEFGQRAKGYETDAAILEALRTQPNVAIADAFAVPADGDIGADEDAFTLTGLKSDDAVFDPVTVELVDPADGSIHPVTIIGIVDEKISSLWGIYANQATVDAVYGGTATTSYYVALDDPDRADAVAKEIEAALFSSGVESTSIRDELKEAQKQESGFLYIIEGFMGLGLVVGTAAVGVIAFRSVVERRQQIGVLRALGFQRGMVALSFMIETAFVVGLGGFAGTVLGLILSRNLFTSEDVGTSGTAFVVPWAIIAVIAVATNVAALLTTWIPARQAARIAPAEALRYE
jgi:putative ABC transport system permease protein